jgi:hypothetical protein
MGDGHGVSLCLGVVGMQRLIGMTVTVVPMRKIGIYSPIHEKHS